MVNCIVLVAILKVVFECFVGFYVWITCMFAGCLLVRLFCLFVDFAWLCLVCLPWFWFDLCKWGWGGCWFVMLGCLLCFCFGVWVAILDYLIYLVCVIGLFMVVAGCLNHWFSGFLWWTCFWICVLLWVYLMWGLLFCWLLG